MLGRAASCCDLLRLSPTPGDSSEDDEIKTKPRPRNHANHNKQQSAKLGGDTLKRKAVVVRVVWFFFFFLLCFNFFFLFFVSPFVHACEIEI